MPDTLVRLYPGAKKGDYFAYGGWVGRLMGTPKSRTPLMEVWGFEHECGSVYAEELHPIDEATAHSRIRELGFDPKDQYYRG